MNPLTDVILTEISEVVHRCSDCKRKLTDSRSIKRGRGRGCQAKLDASVLTIEAQEVPLPFHRSIVMRIKTAASSFVDALRRYGVRS